MTAAVKKKTSFPEDWELEDGRIHRSYRFLKDTSVMKFVGLINDYSRKYKSYPTSVVPGKTSVIVIRASDPITRDDFLFAKAMDTLYKQSMRA